MLYADCANDLLLSLAANEVLYPLQRERRKRTKLQSELWCLRKYLRALSQNGHVAFPIKVEKQETPDFLVSGVRTFGIEVSLATDPWDQKEWTRAEDSENEEGIHFQGKPSLNGRLDGINVTQIATDYIVSSVEKK